MVEDKYAMAKKLRIKEKHLYMKMNVNDFLLLSTFLTVTYIHTRIQLFFQFYNWVIYEE